MKVFITGATGYIGFNVAKVYRQSGHEVFGLTHSPEKTSMLAREEIHPIIGSMQEPDSYRKIAEQSAILVHTAVD